MRQTVGWKAFDAGRGVIKVDRDDEAVRWGLRVYVRSISEAIGLAEHRASVQAPTHASLALDDRLPEYPDRDVVLLWDEKYGWSIAIETHSGEDMIVVAYHGRDALPPPHAVARWLTRLLHGKHRAGPPPDPPRLPNIDDVPARLAAYSGSHAGT